MRNFQGIIFIWIRTNKEIFKSALIYSNYGSFPEVNMGFFPCYLLSGEKHWGNKVVRISNKKVQFH